MGSRLKISHKPDREWRETYHWLKHFLDKNDILPMDFCYAIDIPFTLETSMYFTSESLIFPPAKDGPFRQILRETRKGFYPFALQTLIYRERFSNFYSLNHRILSSEGVLGMRCVFGDNNHPCLEVYLERKRDSIRDLIISLPGWPFAGKFDMYYILRN
jgi:hypothetical protein